MPYLYLIIIIHGQYLIDLPDSLYSYLVQPAEVYEVSSSRMLRLKSIEAMRIVFQLMQVEWKMSIVVEVVQPLLILRQ